MIRGKNDHNHDVNLLTRLHAAHLNGIRFNSKKLQFRQQEVNFYGQVITPEGMRINPDSVEAIRRMEPPPDKTTLQSFLGMVNYMKRYSKDLTQLSHPLRDLVKEGTIYRWDPEHQVAFDALKEEIARSPTLAFYDQGKHHVIQTDASLKGLGAVLLQDGQPVIYASRSLLPAEE
jgi:hypothetical protein